MFMTLNNNLSVKLAVLALGAIVAIFLQKYFGTNSTDITNNRIIFSVEELSSYNGIQQEKLYLAILGKVFDVTKGSSHYVKGAPYHYFIGKDGTRAFVTGDFKDESDGKDHILDLSCNDVLSILQWRRTFKQKYNYVGLLAGRYYDKYGEETNYMKEFKRNIKLCKIKKEEEKEHDKMFPPCNVAWSEEDGSKVWCTKSSGGITRDWEGVPRQLYIPGDERLQCVCVNINNKDDKNLLKEYKGCPSTSSKCSVIDT